jgi:PAS domain S-box-containing protein
MELQRATISEIGLWPQIEVFPLRTSHDSYSALIVAVSDRKAFLPYGPFLRTTADLIVLVLENKAQAAELRSLNTNREEQVSQRINEHLASEARYRAIFETTVDAIITIDERGTILLTNPATEQLFGYRADEMTGENVSLLMPSPDRERHDEYLEHFRRTGIGKIIGTGREVLGRRKDGSTFPIRLAVSEMRGGESACS